MLKSTTAFAAFLTMLGSVSTVTARPHDVRMILKIDLVRAIHTPTGCTAHIEYHDGAFAAGYIVDPLCLPQGVRKRAIPSALQDFYLPLSRSGRMMAQ